MAVKIFAYVKKKQYLCSMKDEIKKYLDSEKRLNEQEFEMRKLAAKLGISLIILGLIGIIIAFIAIGIQ